jgi:hypothetical protein
MRVRHGGSSYPTTAGVDVTGLILSPLLDSGLPLLRGSTDEVCAIVGGLANAPASESWT